MLFKNIISYEILVWIIYSILTSLAIYDRFDWNVWPRQSFNYSNFPGSSDRIVGYAEGPWSVIFYDVCARISGRFAIFSLNLLFLTQCRIWNNWLTKYCSIIDCSDILNGNLRLHTWNGIALVVLTLLHVWSILFPCVIHGWGLQILPGKFEWPLSERKPSGFKDTNASNQMISLQIDDVFRIIEMTLFLGILLPLSVRWLKKYRHIGIQLHRIIAAVYFVDIVRRHTHPHSWFLNTPFFLMYVLDRIWWLYSLRQSPKNIKKFRIGTDYMVIYFDGQKSLSDIGPDYHILLKGTSCLEDPHPFTTFGKHIDIHFENEKFDWSIGTVVRVFRNKRLFCSPESFSHTQSIYQNIDNNLNVWGPSQGEMSKKIKNVFSKNTNVILIGTGSAINYLIDALMHLSKLNYNAKCTIFFSTRDELLFKWSKNVFERINPKIRVVLSLTKLKSENEKLSKTSGISYTSGRIDFTKEIDRNMHVFCQGGFSLKNNVKSICNNVGAFFYGGLGGATESTRPLWKQTAILVRQGRIHPELPEQRMEI